MMRLALTLPCLLLGLLVAACQTPISSSTSAPAPAATGAPVTTATPVTTSQPLASASPTAVLLPVVTLQLSNSQGQVHKLVVEVAATAEQRARGLMFRQQLADDHGMLFIFPADSTSGFWMENTPLPLAIAWIDAGGSIVSQAEMQPLSRAIHAPNAIYRYALELNKNGFSQRQLGLGSQVQWLDGGQLKPLSALAQLTPVR